MTTARWVTEAQWLTAVGDALDYTGWSWIHHRPGRRASGKWADPVQGNSARGWPDVFAVRDDRAIAVELKTDSGRVTPEQTEWLARLNAAGIETHLLFLPRQWTVFERIIAAPPEQLTLTSDLTTASFLAADNER
jgi:hypothetical protein